MPQARLSAKKAALLDFDLTLVDSVPAIMEATNRFADVIGRPHVARERILETIALPFEETWPEFWGDWDPAWPALYRESCWGLESAGLILLPGAVGAMEALKAAGLKTAVVTNRWEAAKAVESAGLIQYFDLVVGFGDSPRPKPAPDPVLKALELLGAEPSEAAFAGDTVVDIQTALAAGVDAVGVTTGPDGREALLSAGAARVIGSIGELPGVLGI